jgi:hypothetical protein
MANHEAHGEPGEITAIDGEVVMHGPGNAGHSMTPEAAAETGRRLTEAAEQAAEAAEPLNQAKTAADSARWDLHDDDDLGSGDYLNRASEADHET